MTSRVSFHKLLIETIRRHIAAVLITVLAFLIYLISFFMNVQNMINSNIIFDSASNVASESEKEYIIEQITELCSPNLGMMFLAMLVGIYLAFEFFRYLHSKKETDFYESMPIKKQTMYVVSFVAGLSIFLLLAVITTALQFGIIFASELSSTLITQNLLWNLVCMLGIFLACWATTALAMVMTGHLIVAFLGFGIFASYIPLIIANLIPVYAASFFETYVYQEMSPIYYYFSPVTLAYKASYNWSSWNIEEHWTYLVGCFAFAIVIGLLSYLLYLRRPAETAGRAMAFEKVNSLIRFIIVIPLTLYVGLFLNTISSYGNTAWLIFGILFGAFLLHGIMECIFQFDIRGLVSKKIQLLITVIICIAFATIFLLDVFRYDEYLPDTEDVESVSIDTYLFNEEANEMEYLQDGLSGDYVDDALLAIQDIIKSTDYSETEDYFYTNNFTVTYQLKNGSTRKRNYSYYGDKFPESLDKLSTIEEFNDDFCVFYHKDKIQIHRIGVSNGFEYMELDLTKDELQKLSDIYIKEYTKQTFSEKLSQQAVFELQLDYAVDGKQDMSYARYKVYVDFTETLSFLQSHGALTLSESENIKLENLEIYSSKYDGDKQYVSEEAQLNELKKYMIHIEFMNYTFERSDDYVYCSLRYVIDGKTQYMDVYIKLSDLSNVLDN